MTDKFTTGEHNTAVVPIPSSGQVGAKVVVVEGPDVGASLVITRARHTIGRHPTNDLVLSDPAVSLVHLEVQRATRDLLLVRDAQSTNGAWWGRTV